MPKPVNVIDNEDLYNVITLAGVNSPGKVTLSGHDRKIGWDVKSGPSQKGASTTLKEIPPMAFKASFYLVRDDSQGIDQISEWPDFATLINSTVNGSKPKALDIYHPDLAANKFTSVVLANMGGAVHDGKGGVTYVVEFQEYAPPKPKGGSPSGSKTAKPTAAPDPNAAANAELAALTATYATTPWGEDKRSDAQKAADLDAFLHPPPKAP